jgi:hypothetical protein
MKIQKLLFGLLISFSLSGLSCASKIILEDKNPTPEPVGESTPEAKVDDFEARLKQIQTGDFTYVYAFRRKDGEELSSDDVRFFKENSPEETNQRFLTADRKAIIAGSNFVFPPENLDALKKRFKIEDYSPKKETNANVNR